MRRERLTTHLVDEPLTAVMRERDPALGALHTRGFLASREVGVLLVPACSTARDDLRVLKEALLHDEERDRGVGHVDRTGAVPVKRRRIEDFVRPLLEIP